jgi:hypothetical protein
MDRQTDMTKPTVAFRNFANVPKNDLSLYKSKVHVKDAALWAVPTLVMSEMTQKLCFLSQK